MLRHTLIFIEKIKILTLEFEACHSNSMTTVVFRNREEKNFNKIKKNQTR